MASGPGIEGVLFDFGGVCIPLQEESVWGGLAALYHTIDPSKRVPSDFFERTLKTLMRELSVGLEVSQFWEKLKRYTRIVVPKDADQMLVGGYGTIRRIDPLMEDLVDRLKRNGYKVGLVSNTIKPHVKVFRANGLYEPFEPNITLSCEVGWAKPDEEIWADALNRLGVTGTTNRQRASRVVFVDDVPDYSRAYSEILGGHAVLHTSPERTIGELEALGLRLSKNG